MAQKKKKSICIISFSPIIQDARVLRQIQYLSPHYDLNVIGEGVPDPAWQEMDSIIWNPIPPIRAKRNARELLSRISGLALLLSGKIHPAGYLHWYWRQPIMKETLAKAVASGCDAFHANDWNTLPLAAEAAKQLNARLVFDAHEYGPSEFEHRRFWRLTYSPMISSLLRHYASCADISITVAPALAERYRQEYPMEPMVIMSAPRLKLRLPNKEVDPYHIRLIHHGAALPVRRLELMISALVRCDRRYSLHFMLTGKEAAYIRYLENLANQEAPGRITFHPPVAPEDIVERISEFDMGFGIFSPATYNSRFCLPNKFFDFIAAGLAVCIGPSPSMAEIVRSYELGCIASSFEPQDIATTLNSLSAEQLVAMRRGARAAAKEINADREMGKLVEIYQRLLPEEQQ